MIKLQCPCGSVLDLPDGLAGKQVRCKRCNKVLTVRQGAPSGGDARAGLTESQKVRLDRELTVQGSRPCPGCGTLYPPAVVVCVGCGLNVDSGAMLYASLDDGSGAPGAPGGAAPPPAAAKPSLWRRVLTALGLSGGRDAR